MTRTANPKGRGLPRLSGGSPAFRRFIFGVLAVLGLLAGLQLFTAGLKLIADLSLRHAAAHPLPEKPIALTLQLPKRKWKRGEELWYLLKVRNISPRTIGLNDSFWVDKDADQNCWTSLSVTGPDGKAVSLSPFWGYHGEYRFWEDASPPGPRPKLRWWWEDVLKWGTQQFYRAGMPGRILAKWPESWSASLTVAFGKKTGMGAVELGPGQEYIATPSEPAPYRDSDSGGLRDARISPHSTPAEAAALRRLASIYSREGEVMGGGAGSVDPFGPQKSLFPGYRILDGRSFWKPGVYRMKATYFHPMFLPLISAEEEIRSLENSAEGRSLNPESRRKIIEKWRGLPPKEHEKIRKDRHQEEWDDKRFHWDPESSKSYLVESNEIEFEVGR